MRRRKRWNLRTCCCGKSSLWAVGAAGVAMIAGVVLYWSCLPEDAKKATTPDVQSTTNCSNVSAHLLENFENRRGVACIGPILRESCMLFAADVVHKTSAAHFTTLPTSQAEQTSNFFPKCGKNFISHILNLTLHRTPLPPTPRPYPHTRISAIFSPQSAQ